jgi:nucleotide-binding universal stress UspA family protein
MTFVVGFAPDGRGRAVLELAAMLSRSAGEDLVVAAVVPAPWAPGPARVDAEYQAELAEVAQAALDQARARLPEGARYVVHHARSTPAGLLEVAEQHEASLIVLGSASAGMHGYVHLGSVSDRLVHSSPIPVALAPRGFRCRGTCPVKRVTVAFGGADDRLVVGAAEVAERVGAALRVASFAVRSRTPIQAGVGREADEAIVAQWERDVRAALGADHELVIGHGANWDEAIEDVEWSDGDVLVVGSSSIGPVARVFLGSRAAKIVRHSPVPVVVVPRG